MHAFIEHILAFFGSLGYLDIFFLMTLESSIFPVPSELVMIPAGLLAKTGSLDPWLAILAGGLGSVFWALLNYYILGRCIGKPLLQKYGKYILITPEKYDRSEKLFLSNQNLYTFIGRLIPVVRHVISIPAGIFRMPIGPFVTITFLGATLWCAILVGLGWFFGQPVISAISRYSSEVGILAALLIAVYVWWKVWKK